MNIVTALREKEIAVLLTEQKIETVFQPIVSIRRGKVIALEALSRFRHSEGHVTSPFILFQKAQEANLRCELDWACMDTALRQFPTHHCLYPDTIVFLNVHADTLTDDRYDALQRLIELSDRYKIPPPNIALELLESGISPSKTQALRQMVQLFKQHGFLVALDDLGIESSNLDRIVSIYPDMIKADSSLVANLNCDHYKQSLFRGLAEIASRIGGWLVAEGIEAQPDALCALALGGDLLQGYLFGRPEPIERVNASFADLGLPIQQTADAFKRQQIVQARTRFEERNERERISQEIVTELAGLKRESMETTLAEAIKRYPQQIESACWLDVQGFQQTDTLLNPHPFLPEKTVIYHPPRRGDSHALKEYFYLLMEVPEQPERFETAPYVPLPTTDLCITRTTRFKDAEGDTAILCLHLKV